MHLLLAIQFLTTIPVRIRGNVSSKDLARSLSYFTMTGFFMGLLASTPLLLPLWFSWKLKVLFCVLLSVLISGALHLDGFADMCDGFYGQRSKDDILRIMRDSCVGVMGVLGIVFLILAKCLILVELGRSYALHSLLIMFPFSRYMMTLICKISSYPRENGKAKSFIGEGSYLLIVINGLFVLIFAFLLLGIKGVIAFFLSIIPVLLFRKYSYLKIGGMTGDTVGASSEIAEVAFLLFSYMVISYV